jgi:hypothetical protein
MIKDRLLPRSSLKVGLINNLQTTSKIIQIRLLKADSAGSAGHVVFWPGGM